MNSKNTQRASFNVKRNERKFYLVAFIVPLVIYLFSLSSKVHIGSNIVAMQYSIWFNHSFSISTNGQPIVNSIDTIVYNGKYYSAFSPGFGIIALPFAILGFLMDGKVLGEALLMDKMFLCLLGSLATLLVYKTCRFYARPNDSLLAAFSLAFATSAWPFTTVLFDHVATMAFLVTGVYLTLRFAKEESLTPRRAYIYFPVIGLALAAAAFIDYIASLAIIPVVLYISIIAFKSKRARNYTIQLILIVATFALGPLANLAYNQSIFGNPLVFPEQFWGSQGSIIQRFNLVNLPSHFLFNLVTPYRGLFLFSPVLLLGLFGIYKLLRNHELKNDALLLLTLFLIIALPYSAWDRWWAGYSFGPRFLIPALPFLVIPISYFLNKSRSSRIPYLVFFVLFFISSSIQGTGALTNATPASTTDLLVYEPISSISNFYHGHLDILWPGSSYLLRISSGLVFIFLWSTVAHFIKGASREKREMNVSGRLKILRQRDLDSQHT